MSCTLPQVHLPPPLVNSVVRGGWGGGSLWDVTCLFPSCHFLPALGTALGASFSIQTALPPKLKPREERKLRTATHIRLLRASDPRWPSSRSFEASSRKHGSTSWSSHVFLLLPRLLPPPSSLWYPPSRRCISWRLMRLIGDLTVPAFFASLN